MVLAGTEEQVAEGLARYSDLGVTDALVSPVGDAGEQARTHAFLGDLAVRSA